MYEGGWTVRVRYNAIVSPEKGVWFDYTRNEPLILCTLVTTRNDL